MTSKAVSQPPSLWAHCRFSIVGSLLSAPVAHGGLRQALQDLADKTWTHPVNGGPIQYSASTIERWYYAARGAKQDPVRVLRRIIRKDCGKISLPAVQVEQLLAQYRAHEHWSYQLHYDNLAAWVQHVAGAVAALTKQLPRSRYSGERAGVRGEMEHGEVIS